MSKSNQHTNIIFGRQPVQEALKSGTSIEKIVILYGTKGNAIDKIRTLAKQQGVPVTEVDKQKFRGYVPQGQADESTTQGVIALAAQASFAEIDDLLAAAKQKNEPPFLLILDEL
ncbi:MAG TPA: RNA methyltransferase substrate-binding domain-containing protein [Bacteroidota bacterium]